MNSQNNNFDAQNEYNVNYSLNEQAADQKTDSCKRLPNASFYIWACNVIFHFDMFLEGDKYQKII